MSITERAGPTRRFVVFDYPPAGEEVARNEAEFGTADEARAEVLRRLGDLDDWRRWDGWEEEDSGLFAVEAYCAEKRFDSGGVHISRRATA